MERLSSAERGPESRVSDFGFSEAQGRRDEMEDAHVQETFTTPEGKRIEFFAIYDGHSGRVGADIAAQRLHTYVENVLQKGVSLDEALMRAFVEIDKEIEAEGRYTHSGTTAAVVLIGDAEIISANVGDTRTLLIDAAQRVQCLTEEHRLVAGNEEEKRIKKIGGKIYQGKYRRVMAPDGSPGIMVSRALGDDEYGALVSAEPFISRTELNKAHRRVIIACDGVFDMLTNEEVADLIKNEPDPKKASELITKTAISRGSGDNVTTVVVNLIL
jgi:protein phosphatase